MGPFRFRMTLDEDVLKELRPCFVPAGWRNVFRIAAVFFLIGVVIHWNDETSEGLQKSVFYLSICAIYLFAVPWRSVRIQRQRLRENGGANSEYAFEEDGIHISYASSGAQYIVDYVHYARFAETKNLFYMETKGRQYIVIPKEAMDSERRTQFLRFVREHCPNLKGIKK